jgi:hypothetical protein
LTAVQDLEVPGRHWMFKLTATYTSCYSDIGTCDTFEEQQRSAGPSTLRRKRSRQPSTKRP